MRGVFVTGTDTEVGKTYVGVALLRALLLRGIPAIGMKPVASGSRSTAEGLRNDDAEQLRAAGPPVDYDLVNPYCFAPPIAPHLAAAAAGVTIRFERILAAASTLRRQADFLLVEGVGGWRVPLGPDGDVAKLAAALDMPVVLVVGLRLGCINHACLTAESIAAAGRPLAGWVGNCIDPDYMPLAETVSTLSELLGTAPLSVFGHRAGLSPATSPEAAAAVEAVEGLLCSKS
jgi:dethiobiotin synthetase